VKPERNREGRTEIRKRRIVRISLPALSALLLLVPLPASAQSAKQEVPDNPALKAGPAQPVPFSHKKHVALGLECEGCHSNPEAGKMMTFPATSVCMQCHEVVATNKPAIQQLTEFAKSGQAVPWVRVYEVTPGVNWGHRTHLQAGVQCVMCHGDVSKLDVMTQLTAVTSMASCINCHQAHSAGTTCHTCHSWPAE
jgi:uncharacterized membrane protein